VTTAATELGALVNEALSAIAVAEEGQAAHPDTSMRERFFELLVLILGNLYTKTPVAAPLFDRTTLLRVTTGMDDNDAGRLAARTEDWLRLEGLLRQQDGAKAFSVSRPALAVLSTLTEAGTLGEVYDRILKRYAAAMPTEEVRHATRTLGSYFISRVARN
jgi:hypothetical protein